MADDDEGRSKCVVGIVSVLYGAIEAVDGVRGPPLVAIDVAILLNYDD